jgi:tetratricopeptide (TPR) repeat protein
MRQLTAVGLIGFLVPSVAALCSAAFVGNAVTTVQAGTAASEESRLTQGDSALAAGHHREALESYNAFLDRAPDRLDVRAKRAIALFRLGHLDAARQEMRTIRLRTINGLESELRQRPDDASLLGRVARLHSELRDDEAALAHARHLVEVQPASAEAHFTLGNVLYRAGQVRAAQDSYDLALSHDHRKTEAYVARAASRLRMGDRAGAADDLRRAREILP